MKAKHVTRQDLSGAEIAFIQQHGIRVDEILDARGMIPIGQKRSMEASGARLAITDRRCRQNHRLKTRSNHCPVCDPKNLAFEKRHSQTAFVYVCKSETGLIKIGYAQDPRDREGRLSRERFASCSAWRLVFSTKSEKAGKVEALAHTYLAGRSSAETYLKGSVEVTSREVFACSQEDAIAAVNQAMRDLAQ